MTRGVLVRPGEEGNEGTIIDIRKSITTTSLGIRQGASEATLSLRDEILWNGITAPTFGVVLSTGECPSGIKTGGDTGLVVVRVGVFRVPTPKLRL